MVNSPIDANEPEADGKRREHASGTASERRRPPPCARSLLSASRGDGAWNEHTTYQSRTNKQTATSLRFLSLVVTLSFVTAGRRVRIIVLLRHANWFVWIINFHTNDTRSTLPTERIAHSLIYSTT